MRLKDHKENYLNYFFLFLVLLLTSLILCLFELRYIATLQVNRENERFRSFTIAEQLRFSSDDLTKMVRQYVMTGDKKYYDFYNEVLTIRAGKSPRPAKYDQIYWDFVLNPAERPTPFMKPESIYDLMKSHHFAPEEFALLNEAVKRSQALTALEIKAMNAVEGKFIDKDGNYTITGKPNHEMAQDLVFGQQYMNEKAMIMRPIQDFLNRVINRTKESEHRLNDRMSKTIKATILLAIISTTLMLISIFKALRSLAEKNKENDLLLLNIFPASIASRLKRGEGEIADEFHQASVMFADIINFTQLTEELGPKKIVSMLNQFFDELDNMTEQFEVEKVKTIGDNYMAVSGVPIPNNQHAENLASYALAILSKLDDFNTRNGRNIQLRIGMSSGTVIAGVIGHKKFVYDVWGNVVNLASRLEGFAKPNTILISERMALILADKYQMEAQQPIELKGLGLISSYYLLGEK